MVTFVSLSAPPSLPLLEQVALKAAAAQNAQGLWPWFQSQGDTVWLAEEEDASMHAGMSDASLPGGAVELVPLSELVDFSIQVHVARQPAGSSQNGRRGDEAPSAGPRPRGQHGH